MAPLLWSCCFCTSASMLEHLLNFQRCESSGQARRWWCSQLGQCEGWYRVSNGVAQCEGWNRVSSKVAWCLQGLCGPSSGVAQSVSIVLTFQKCESNEQTRWWWCTQLGQHERWHSVSKCRLGVSVATYPNGLLKFQFIFVVLCSVGSCWETAWVWCDDR